MAGSVVKTPLLPLQGLCRFIHYISTDSHLFLFMAEQYSIVYMYHNFLIHSSANVNLGYYYVLVIVNSDAVNTEVVVELLSRV